MVVGMLQKVESYLAASNVENKPEVGSRKVKFKVGLTQI